MAGKPSHFIYRETNLNILFAKLEQDQVFVMKQRLKEY